MNKLKKKKIIGLALSTLIVLVIMHLNFGLFNRFNFITAYWDKWTGNERIIIYGERFETDSLKSVLAPKFGFRYERQEDCSVTTPFVNGVKDYNEIMGQEITQRLGDDWGKVLDKEISKIK